MGSSNALDLRTLKADKVDQIRNTKKKPLISVAKETSFIEERKEEDIIIKTDEILNEPVTKKRRLSIRSSVQSIRDDIYQGLGERITGIEFCHVPAGTFRMGGIGHFHRVRISRDFYLGKYPVTQSQWQAVMENNPSPLKGQICQLRQSPGMIASSL